MIRKPFVAMLLSIIFIAVSGDGKIAAEKQYEAVTLAVKRAIAGVRHQLPKRLDEVTTLIDAYIDPDDDRKVVFVSTISVTKGDIDRKKWQDLAKAA